MIEIEVYLVREYEFDNPHIQTIGSIRDCHHKYFHTFDHICEYNLNFTNTDNKESVNFTISDKNMNMCEINKKINTCTRKRFEIFSNLSNINIHHHLRLGSSPLRRQFFIKFSNSLQ